MPASWSDLDYDRNQTAITDAYQVWLDNNLLPQTPSKITFEHEDRTEVVKLANGGSLTLGRREGPITVKFEFKDTIGTYAYTFRNGRRFDWSDVFYIWKTSEYPFEFTIHRHPSYLLDVNMKVILTDWTFWEDAEEGSDFTYSITLMEYMPQKNQETDADVQHHLVKNRDVAGWRSGGRK